MIYFTQYAVWAVRPDVQGPLRNVVYAAVHRYKLAINL